MADVVCDGTPDSYGYRCVVGDEGPIDITAGTELDLGNDVMSPVVALPWDFELYGETYDSVSISSNGFLTFLSGQPSACCIALLGSPALPNAVVAGSWANLDPSAGGTVRYGTVGMSPEERFVVEWRGVPMRSGMGVADVQIVLFEVGGLIEIRLGDAVEITRDPVWIGVESFDGSDALVLNSADGQISGNRSYRIRAGDLEADPGGPYFAAEGGAPLTVSAVDSVGEILEYAWDFDGDGEYDDGFGMEAQMPLDGLDGPVEVQIGLQVTSSAFEQLSATTVVQVRNVPPYFTTTPPPVARIEEEYVYQVMAEDPAGELDPLDLVLTGSPGDMRLSESGLLTWTPTMFDVDQVYEVTVVAGDGDLGVAEQTWPLAIVGNDADGDSVSDVLDNCDDVPNTGQEDNDSDRVGDACDDDDDNDEVLDVDDNCVFVANADQADLDGDGLGDECDDDDDADFVPDADDNCPRDTNPTQNDQNDNGYGDACDNDRDQDDYDDDVDNCPEIANNDQADLDGDDIGDVCDDDIDGDGLDNDFEEELGTSPVLEDTDRDRFADGVEETAGSDPLDPLSTPDTDRDGILDLDEIRLGTNPNEPDSDVDGLADGRELDLGTDPVDEDSDDDGLRDGEEVVFYDTDPLDADSDDGGVDDGTELALETDPNEPSDDREPDTGSLGGSGCSTGAGRTVGWMWVFVLLGVIGWPTRPRAGERRARIRAYARGCRRLTPARIRAYARGCRRLTPARIRADARGCRRLTPARIRADAWGCRRLTPAIMGAVVVALLGGACGSNTGSDPDASADVDPADAIDAGGDVDAATSVCGDGACDIDEDVLACPDDCAEAECIIGQRRCVSETQRQVCDGEDLRWDVVDCPVGQVCLAITGECSPVVCRPGETDGCVDETTLSVCNATGTGYDELTCPPEQVCDEPLGVAECTNQICDPGDTQCTPGGEVTVCNADGDAWEPGECPRATACEDGTCTTLCEINAKVASFLGCDYFSVDFDNIEEGTEAAHAVVISNPSDTLTAEIEIRRGTGEELQIAEWDLEIPPGELGIFRFDGAYVDQLTGEALINTRYVNGTIIGDQSFRVRTSIPTTVHQFNPLVDVNVYTNDASLLLPANAVGREYLAMSWRHRTLGNDISGFVSVIATSDEPTRVTIVPTTEVREGLNRIDGSEVDSIAAGEEFQITLQTGEFVYLHTSGPAGADLTGTWIEADQPVAVFSGHECANVPTEDINACDHIEQQMFPVDAWGRRYFVSSFSPRAEGDAQVFRILAAENDTIVTTNPPQFGVDGLPLAFGEYVEFITDADFEVTASAPVLVGQYMMGSDSEGGAEIGDPAFTLAVPVEQWRNDYIVLTPPAYDQGDFLNVMAASGVEILLDGTPVDSDLFEAIGDTGYMAARVPVDDGVHRLNASEPFGVIAYGYDEDVSYAYPGGMDLEPQR